MASQQRNFQDKLARISKERLRRAKRRQERREEIRIEARSILTKYRSTNNSESYDPRTDAMPLRSAPQRTKRSDWRSVSKDCLKLIEDCQEIIGRLQSNVNQFASSINHGNLLQISTEAKPEPSLRDSLERLKHRNHYQLPYETSQTIERLMSSSHPSSSLCPLQIIEVSLVCPLSKTKIKLPIRGKQCMHLGCCDAGTFLSLVEGKPLPKWKCPICTLPMPYEDIRVDVMISNIINEVKEEVLKVEFTSGTTWRVKENKGSSSSTSHKLSNKTKEIIDLTYSPLSKVEKTDSGCHLIDLTDTP